MKALPPPRALAPTRGAPAVADRRRPEKYVLDTNAILMISRDYFAELYDAAEYAVYDQHGVDYRVADSAVGYFRDRLRAKGRAFNTLAACASMDGVVCYTVDVVLEELLTAPHPPAKYAAAMVYLASRDWRRAVDFMVEHAREYHKRVFMDWVKPRLPKSIVDRALSTRSMPFFDRNATDLLKDFIRFRARIVNARDPEKPEMPAGWVMAAHALAAAVPKLDIRCRWHGGGFTYTDAALLALAVREDATLVTADRDLAAAALALGLGDRLTYLYPRLPSVAGAPRPAFRRRTGVEVYRVRYPCTERNVEVEFVRPRGGPGGVRLRTR